MVDYNGWFLCVEASLCLWNEDYLIMVYDLFAVFFDLVDKYFIDKIKQLHDKSTGEVKDTRSIPIDIIK